MSVEDEVLCTFEAWYLGLPVVKPNGGPAKGTMAGALVVLERLRTDFSLDIDRHTASGGAQIIGVSGEAVKKILARFGDSRRFLSEGGRTNRGLRGDIEKMLKALSNSALSEVDVDQRATILTKLQGYLVERIDEFHRRKRLDLSYDPTLSAWTTVNRLLELADTEGKAGAVAQYLVGAKLQLRFPTMQIGNESFSTADAQLNRSGDFEIHDTAFHVSVAPQSRVYERCLINLQQGKRAYLIVPEKIMQGTKQNADLAAQGRITVTSVEAFVSQNVEELAGFKTKDLASRLLSLFETYNTRVGAVEADKSLLIEIPVNLRAES